MTAPGADINRFALVRDRELRDLIERVGFAYDLLDLDGDVSVCDFADIDTHQRILRVLDHAASALRDTTEYLIRLRERAP